METIKDKSDISDLNYSKSHRKYDTHNNPPKNMERITKSLISKYVSICVIIQHTKGNNDKNNNKGTMNNTKNIHAMKELIKAKADGNTSTNNITKNTNNSTLNNSNIILNQKGVPCYNNINIYTSGINGLKGGDINLRQYIFNKVNLKSQNGIKINKKPHHARSNSAMTGI